MGEALNMEDIREFFKNDRFAVENGMEITKVEPGRSEARMKISKHHLNGNGTVQGGAIYTLADYAFAAAANAKGFMTVSSSASISYFRPPKGEYLTAKAHEISSGRKLCTYDVDIFDGEDTLAARLTGSGYILGKLEL